MTELLVVIGYVVTGFISAVWYLRYQFRAEGELDPSTDYMMAMLIACCGVFALIGAVGIWVFAFFSHRLVPEHGRAERAKAAKELEARIKQQQRDLNEERRKLGLKPLDWT